MILMLTREEDTIKNILKRQLRRYDISIMKTGLEMEILNLLIDIYLRPEFGNHREEG